MDLNKHTFDCPVCNKTRLYFEKYDSYYCEDCKEWSEEPCGDEDCSFCSNRPVTLTIEDLENGK